MSEYTNPTEPVDWSDSTQPQVSPIDKQATINIGIIGHVANGKSTLVRQLTGITTGQHSKEKKRNCTISLGYANCKIYQCDGCLKYDHGPSSSTNHPCRDCTGQCVLVRHVSFVDCPGHDQLISTMINGASVMDGAILVTAANEPCPQPQTQEHLMAAELMGVEHYVKIQNKVDLVNDKEALLKHAEDLNRFTEGTNAHAAPLIPIIAQTGVNLDAVVEAIATSFPIPSHNLQDPLRMSVIRTFKVSTPGMPLEDLRGGVLGGSIMSGLARVGDLIEIRPGLPVTQPDGSRVVTPIFTRVQSLQCDTAQLDYAIPGGLIGMQTDLDPYLCMGDRLVGQVAGAPGTLPPVLSHIALSYQRLKRITEGSVSKLCKGGKVVIHVGAAEVTGVVTKIDKQKPLPVVLLKLNSPVCCTTSGQAVTVFIGKKLVGYGTSIGGKSVEIPEPPSLDTLLTAPTLRQASHAKKPKPRTDKEPTPSVPRQEQVIENTSDNHPSARQLLASCRFYEQDLPQPQDMVTVLVDRIEKHGVYVTLPEYGGIDAFIPLAQLTRKNYVRNLRSIVWPGLETVCCVTSVDTHTKYIDLTKSRVTKDEVKQHQAAFGDATLAHQVLCRAAAVYNPSGACDTLLEMYNTIAWPLAALHGSVHDGLLAGIKDHICPETDLTMNDVIMVEAARRMKPRASRCSAEVGIHCMGPLGVHAVRAVLHRGQQDTLSLKVDVPPVYRLSCETDTDTAAQELWRSIRMLEAEAKKLDCSFQIKKSPHTIVHGQVVSLDEPEQQQLPTVVQESVLVSEARVIDTQRVDQEVSWLLDVSSTAPEEDEQQEPVNYSPERGLAQNYEELLDQAIDREALKPVKLRLPVLQILTRPKLTLVANFGIICKNIRRPLHHFMLYLTTELGTTASLKGDGCGLVIRGRFKPNHVEGLTRRYCNEFVKCLMCGSFKTTMNHNSSIRSNVQQCEHCCASRTLDTINQKNYQAQIGRRPRA